MKITGHIPKTKRFVTDLWSFDRAFENQKGEIGFPLGTIVEISGKHSTGKSTTAYGISGLVANYLKCDIALLDFEGFDPIFLETVLGGTGFDGEVRSLQEDKDEDAMDLLVSTMGDKKHNFGVGILDSIGAISPVAEAEGELGDANMGLRAKLLGQFSRKLTKVIRDYKEKDIHKTLFAINHQLPQLGGKGTYTPGGLAKEYLSGVRIQLKLIYLKGKFEIFPDASYVLEGLVTKNKSGMKNRKFYLFMLNGKGIHKGLTWMYDGFMNKAVTRKSFLGDVKIGDKQIGKMRQLVDKAHEGDEEFFTPFREALARINDTAIGNDTNEDSQDTEDSDSSTDEI